MQSKGPEKKRSISFTDVAAFSAVVIFASVAIPLTYARNEACASGKLLPIVQEVPLWGFKTIISRCVYTRYN
jgi:hypothetical protein